MSRARNLANLLNSSGDVKSDRLDNVPVYDNVSGSSSGLMTTALKSKLDAIEANATADQSNSEIKTAYEANANTNAFTDADHSKLDGIEASADVTDTANVTSAGALMDSEVTNLAQVKAFNSADYATAAHNHSGVYEPANATILKDADIGSTVQAYDATILKTSDIGSTVLAPNGSGASLTNLPSSPSVGVGQTWQSVSRSSNVNYTNTTGSPILCSVTSGSVQNPGMNFYSGGIPVAYHSTNAGGRFWLSAIVPAGQVYKCTGSVGYWRELR